MVVAVGAFLFGYAVSIMQENIMLNMERTAQTVDDRELSKYNIEYDNN